MPFIFSKSCRAATLITEEEFSKTTPKVRREYRKLLSSLLPEDAIPSTEDLAQAPYNLSPPQGEPVKTTPNPISPVLALALLHTYHYADKGSPQFRNSLRTISVRYGHYSHEHKRRVPVKRACVVGASTLSKFCIDQSKDPRARRPLSAGDITTITPREEALLPRLESRVPADKETFTKAMNERIRYSWQRTSFPEQGDFERKKKSDERKRGQKPSTEGRLAYARMNLISTLKEDLGRVTSEDREKKVKRLLALGVEVPAEDEGTPKQIPTEGGSAGNVLEQTSSERAKTIAERMRECQAQEDKESTWQKWQEKKARWKKGRHNRQSTETERETQHNNDGEEAFEQQGDIWQTPNRETRGWHERLLALMGGLRPSRKRRHTTESYSLSSI